MSFIDSFQNTFTANQVITRTYGFEPGFVFINGDVNSTESQGAPVNSSFSFTIGACIGASGKSSRLFGSINGQSPSKVYDEQLTESDTGISGRFNSNGTLAYLLDLVSLNSSGAQFVMNTGASSLFTRNCLAIPKSRISQSAYIRFSPVSAGAQFVSCGFQPDVLVFVDLGGLSVKRQSIGCAVRRGGSAVNAIAVIADSNFSNPTYSASYCRLDDCLAQPVGGTLLDYHSNVTSFTSTGFNLFTTTLNSSSTAIGCFALKAAPGYAFGIASGLTSTSTTPFFIDAPGIIPDSGFVCSSSRSENSNGVTSSDGELSIGMFAPSGNLGSNRRACSVNTRNGLSTSRTLFDSITSGVYSRIENSTTTRASVMNVTSFAPGKLGLTMLTPDSSPRFFWAFLSGKAARSVKGAPIFF